MAAPLALKEKTYRAYMEFFETSERKRRWNPFNDVPWDDLTRFENTEDDAICAETFCGVELYVPDYTANGFNLTRPIFGHAWFQASWGFEESRHAVTFREYLVRSGLRSPEQYQAFEDAILSKTWSLPFATRRQMSCYGALQEAATYLIYRAQRENAQERGHQLLERLYFFISRDEAAHMGFYRTLLKFELAEDRPGTLSDLAHVIKYFEMPGVKLVPEFERRIQVKGVALPSKYFLEHGVLATLKAIGVTRIELLRALQPDANERGRSEAERGAVAT